MTTFFPNAPAIFSHKKENLKVVTTSNFFLKLGKPFRVKLEQKATKRTKIQPSTSNLQRMFNLQISIGFWSFFGAWKLPFGASFVVFPFAFYISSFHPWFNGHSPRRPAFALHPPARRARVRR
jgi:hypothetical protein